MRRAAAASPLDIRLGYGDPDTAAAVRPAVPGYGSPGDPIAEIRFSCVLRAVNKEIFNFCMHVAPAIGLTSVTDDT